MVLVARDLPGRWGDLPAFRGSNVPQVFLPDVVLDVPCLAPQDRLHSDVKTVRTGGLIELLGLAHLAVDVQLQPGHEVPDAAEGRHQQSVPLGDVAGLGGVVTVQQDLVPAVAYAQQEQQIIAVLPLRRAEGVGQRAVRQGNGLVAVSLPHVIDVTDEAV